MGLEEIGLRHCTADGEAVRISCSTALDFDTGCLHSDFFACNRLASDHQPCTILPSFHPNSTSSSNCSTIEIAR